MTDVLIELGEPGQHDGSGQRWQPPRHHRRRVVLGVVIIALLLTVAASGGRSPRLSELLWSTGPLRFLVPSEHTVYTVPLDGAQVQARDPDTGVVRWQLAVDRPAAYLVEVGRGVVAVVVRDDSQPPPDGDQFVQQPDATVLLVRVDSGQIIGRATGDLWAVVGGRLLLIRAGELCGRAESCQTLVGLDPATAAQLWTLPLGYRASFAGDDRGQWLATLGEDDDSVVIHSAATGAAAATVALPDGFDAGTDDQRVMFIFGDVLVLGHRESDHVVIEGHPVGLAGASWTRNLPTDPIEPDATTWFYATPCAGLLCVNIDGTTALMEPMTGALRGRTEPDVTVDSDRLSARADPVANEHAYETLVAVRDPFRRTGTDRGVILLRSADASEVASFTGASLVPWATGPGRWLLAQETDTQTVLSVADWRGYRRPVGAAPGTQLTCQAYERILACFPPNGGLRVWRLPSPAELAAGVGDGRS